ncbi:MAG: hypothetical protein WB756_19935 [Xanthobacteraceae bacterium]
MGDIDTAAVDSLKTLDPKRPIREATEQRTQFYVGSVPPRDIRPAGPSTTGWPYLSRSGNAIYYGLGVTRAQREPGQHEFHQREHRITSIIRHQRP